VSAPVLSVSGLRKSFTRGGASVAALDDVTFDVAAGETLALAGPSGSGKSTLARLVMQLTKPDGGRVELNGQDLSAMAGARLRAARRHFQMVFQDTTGAFNPRATVASALEEPLRIHRIAARAERPRRIAHLLEQVGLSPTLAPRAIHEISGGQRQRVAIARAIATEPGLLVLDEALSAIDSSLRGDILRLLIELQQTRNTAYLFISHDLAMVRAVAHRVAIMDAGRIVEIGEARAVVDAPQSDIGQALVAAIPRLNPGKGSRND